MDRRGNSTIRGAVVAASLCVAVALSLTACGSSSSSSSSSTSGSAPTTDVAKPDATPAVGGSTITTVETPPPNPDGSAGTTMGDCDLVLQRSKPDDLRPRDSSNWNNERQRILVDANLSVELLGSATDTFPAQIRSALTTERDYALFVVGVMGSATSFPDAIAGLDGYPDRAKVAAADAELSAWAAANC